MASTLENTIKDICELVQAPTYSDLQRLENSMKSKGIIIEDDFIMTEDRKNVLEKMKHQFSHVETPTAIISGWFGSGRTAILHRISNALLEEELLYGSLNVDPIEFRLVEQNTLHKFLTTLLNEVSRLTSEDWLTDFYKKIYKSLDLAALQNDSLSGICNALVETHVSIMTHVAEFLEELFKEYKRFKNNQRIISLIIDELENITRLAELSLDEDLNKLSNLIRILLRNSVEHYIDKESIRQNPFVLVIFSIPERIDLERGGWLPQDTAERCTRVEHNVNLNPETAIFLMKQLLNMYFKTYLEVATKDTDDNRLNNWLAQLRSADVLENDKFTYPIMPEVHNYICHRVLRTTVGGSILSFRAYQDALSSLLKLWPGEGQIDMRYAISKVADLRYNLENHRDKINMDSLIGEEQVLNLIRKQFPRFSEGNKLQLSLFTLAAMTRKTTPIVMLRFQDVPTLLPDEKKTLSENAFTELLTSLSSINITGWSVTGDTIYISVEEIINQLEKPIEKVKPEDTLQELLSKTQTPRQSSSLSRLFAERFTDPQVEAWVDGEDILHIRDKTPRGQLIEEYLLGFDLELDTMNSIIGTKKGCCIGIIFTEVAVNSIDDIPFKLHVVLPQLLQNRAPKYEAEVRQALITRWQDKFQPLIRAIKKSQSCTYYQAFEEAIKVMLIIPRLPNEEQRVWAEYEVRLERIIFEQVSLDIQDREEWIRSKLGFNGYHDIQPTKKLIKVLSWAQGNEKIIYESSDEVNPTLNKKFDVNLPPPLVWKKELLSDWSNEDFISNDTILPFESWRVERQEIYQFVNENLSQKGDSLTFIDVGKLLFGNCRFDFPKAQTPLHLFLKLGSVPPFGWRLRDDSDEYPSMKVQSGQLLLKQILSHARERTDSLLRNFVLLYYLGSQESRSNYIEDIRKIYKWRSQLTDDASYNKIKGLADELDEYKIPQIGKVKLDISPEIISRLPNEVGKFGEFYIKLNDLCQKGRWISPAIAPKASKLNHDLKDEIQCELYLQSISKIYTNWGQKCTEVPKTDRALLLIAVEYQNALGKTASWADTLIEETDRAYEAKVSTIQENKLEEDVNSISSWLEGVTNSVIKPSWKKTYSNEDVINLKSILSTTEKTVKEEITGIAKEVDTALSEIIESSKNTAFSKSVLQLGEHRKTLDGDKQNLSQCSQSLYTVRFGPVLTSTRKDIDGWNKFHSEILKKLSDRIDTWLQMNDLEKNREYILPAMDKTNMSISDIDKELRQQGIDPLKVLKGQEDSAIIALFAAVQLIEYLKMEVTDVNSGPNSV